MTHTPPMRGTLQRGVAFGAAAVTVGLTTAVLGALPAQAAPATCAYGATLISTTVCELTVESATATVITPTPEMGTLEAVLVGGGGDGRIGDNGYSSTGGGGGAVRVVGFETDPAQAITIVVGGAGAVTTSTQGPTIARAEPGRSGYDGGASGSGFLPLPLPAADSHRGGAGAGGSPLTLADGGPGLPASAVAAPGSLFENATTPCYGGGGASDLDGTTTVGVATCGGGYVTYNATAAQWTSVPPRPHSGGGGEAARILTGGAAGIAVLRWSLLEVPTVAVTFDMGGHGDPVPAQAVAFRSPAVQPADPSAAGFTFDGWFQDAALTIPADFSAEISDPVTFYAAWSSIPVVEPTATATPTPQPTATATAEPTPEPTATATAEPTPEPTASATPTSSGTPTATAVPAPTGLPSSTPDATTSAPAEPLAQSGAAGAGGIAMLSAAMIAAGLALAGFAARRVRRQR